MVAVETICEHFQLVAEQKAAAAGPCERTLRELERIIKTVRWLCLSDIISERNVAP